MPETKTQISERKTLTADTWTEFDFDMPIVSAYVQNLTAGDAFVSLGAVPESDTGDLTVKSLMGRNCFISEKMNISFPKLYVKVASGGDVEVQVTDW